MKSSKKSSEKKVSLKVTIQIELILLGIWIQIEMRHHPGALILANAFLEEVRLSLQRDQLHEIERILDIPLFRAT